MEIYKILFFFFVYIFGSIPFAFILPKLFNHIDIRKIGSGNVGATNVLRTGNKFLAIIVLISDIFKGFIPFFVLKQYYQNDFSEFSIILISSFAIIGHIFPVFLRFKGGKGVATYIGFLFAFNHSIGIIFIIMWILIAYLKKFSSLASIISLILLPFILISFSLEKDIILLFIFISLIIVLKHKSNIFRIINKKESKIKF